MNEFHQSPFRYPGGKFYARKLILPLIPPHDTYGEPFLGGGQIFFCKQSSNVSLINDLDVDLVSTYRVIKNSPMELIRALQDEIISKERHGFYKSQTPQTEIGRAIRWFYLNRTSYSGIMVDSSCYLGYTKGISIPPTDWGTLITRAYVRLNQGNVIITARDFEQAIAQYDQNTFAFIDPPYFKPYRSLYNCEFDQEDHERLARVLFNKRNKFRFLLTYDDSAEIRNLYKWATITPQNWRYSIKYESTDQEAEAKEIFIENSSLC